MDARSGYRTEIRLESQRTSERKGRKTQTWAFLGCNLLSRRGAQPLPTFANLPASASYFSLRSRRFGPIYRAFSVSTGLCWFRRSNDAPPPKVGFEVGGAAGVAGKIVSYRQ
ncbi:hypothetical protein SERLA73DRAFT_79452 [Serpula lacrymans var. lacrymans S7.3]|uniref:Uncharacterized protein n=2 Tax=Serpula lacrymans var. lacrymans TaxID=341189 RepID=F8QGG7_SERL3|nr:uncharacterized protein SERLADRAFT_434635 [Serpula lacrymans var. lacrymans S7.9]EGN92645.1 hypothetical protein SERLA73DRAFT_79452 [Serpula lacrymans var. lacrymans S7.3]EGO28728.1 hypothetical protein SERLADRAFT_434635 [Serpula lacrymans var. lacrymans S7.9]